MFLTSISDRSDYSNFKSDSKKLVLLNADLQETYMRVWLPLDKHIFYWIVDMCSLCY